MTLVRCLCKKRMLMGVCEEVTKTKHHPPQRLEIPIPMHTSTGNISRTVYTFTTDEWRCGVTPSPRVVLRVSGTMTHQWHLMDICCRSSLQLKLSSTSLNLGTHPCISHEALWTTHTYSSEIRRYYKVYTL